MELEQYSLFNYRIWQDIFRIFHIQRCVHFKGVASHWMWIKSKRKKRIHNNRKMHPNDTQFIIINRNPIHENRNMNDMPCQHAGWSLLIVSQIFSFIDSSNNAFLVGVVIVGRVVCTRTFIPMPFVEFSHRQYNN